MERNHGVSFVPAHGAHDCSSITCSMDSNFLIVLKQKFCVRQTWKMRTRNEMSAQCYFPSPVDAKWRILGFPPTPPPEREAGRRGMGHTGEDWNVPG